MPMIRMNVSDEGKAAMVAAAEKAEMPLSVWMRVKLLEIARAAPSGAAAPPEKKYQWLGKPCTKEFHEARMAERAAREADLDGLPPLDESLNEETYDPDAPVVAPTRRRAHAKK